MTPTKVRIYFILAGSFAEMSICDIGFSPAIRWPSITRMGRSDTRFRCVGMAPETRADISNSRANLSHLRSIMGNYLITINMLCQRAHSLRLAAHGLRAGFVTTAYRNGVSDEEIMRHTRHRSLSTMRSYVRRSKLKTSEPTGKLGL